MVEREVMAGEHFIENASEDSFSDILKNKYIYVLLLITAIGALLRFYHISFNSLWIDEIATYNYSKLSFIGTWNAVLHGEYNPPLFYWIEHLMLFIGNSEFILRFIPAIIGIATIPVTYLIGQEIGDKNAGLIAAALITFSPIHIYYSQEARAYTLVTFFIALALLFCLKGLSQKRLWPWVLFGVFSSLAFWSHFYALIAIAILIAYALIYSWFKIKNIKGVISGLSIFLVTTLPLLVVMVKLFFERVATYQLWGVGLPFINRVIFQMSAKANMNPDSAPAGFYDSFMMKLFLILFVVGMLFLFNRKKYYFGVLGAVMVGTLAFSAILSYKMSMANRFLLYLLPMYLMGAAFSYRVVFHFVKSKYAVYGIILLTMAFLIPFGSVYYHKQNKEDWRGVINYLDQSGIKSGNIVFVPGWESSALNFYRCPPGTKLVSPTSLTQLEQVQKSYNSQPTYYIVTSHVKAGPEGDMSNWIKKNSALVQNFSGGIDLYK